MRAIGLITENKGAFGKKIVSLFYWNEKTKKQEWHDYLLENEKMIPASHPDFGVFNFSPDDQFCRWIDPENIP